MASGSAATKAANGSPGSLLFVKGNMPLPVGGFVGSILELSQPDKGTRVGRLRSQLSVVSIRRSLRLIRFARSNSEVARSGRRVDAAGPSDWDKLVASMSSAR